MKAVIKNRFSKNVGANLKICGFFYFLDGFAGGFSQTTANENKTDSKAEVKSVQ